MSQFVERGCRDAPLLSVERHLACGAEMLGNEFQESDDKGTAPADGFIRTHTALCHLTVHRHKEVHLHRIHITAVEAAWLVYLKHSKHCVRL